MITPSFYKTLIRLTRGTGSLFQAYSRGWKKKLTHGKAAAASPEQRDFPAVHWADSWCHTSDLKQKWSGRSDAEGNGMGVSEVSGAQSSGAFPSLVTSRRRGSLNSQLQLLCWGLSCLRALPWTSAHATFVPSKPGCRTAPSASRRASPALQCPGWQCWVTGLEPAAPSCESRTFRVVEHHLLVPWPGTHGQPPPPEAPHKEEGAPLPSCSSCCVPFRFFCYSYNSAAMSGFSGWLGLIKVFLHFSIPVWMKLHLHVVFIPSVKVLFITRGWIVSSLISHKKQTMPLLRTRTALKTPGKGPQDNQSTYGFISILCIIPVASSWKAWGGQEKLFTTVNFQYYFDTSFFHVIENKCLKLLKDLWQGVVWVLQPLQSQSLPVCSHFPHCSTAVCFCPWNAASWQLHPCIYQESANPRWEHRINPCMFLKLLILRNIWDFCSVPQHRPFLPPKHETQLSQVEEKQAEHWVCPQNPRISLEVVGFGRVVGFELIRRTWYQVNHEVCRHSCLVKELLNTWTLRLFCQHQGFLVFSFFNKFQKSLKNTKTKAWLTFRISCWFFFNDQDVIGQLVLK